MMYGMCDGVCVCVCVCRVHVHVWHVCIRTYVARGVCLVLYVSMLDKCTKQSM